MKDSQIHDLKQSIISTVTTAILESEKRLESRMDARFDAMQSQIDYRFADVETRLNKKIDGLDAKFTRQLADKTEEILSAVAEAFHVVHVEIDDHEQRLLRLERKAA